MTIGRMEGCGIGQHDGEAVLATTAPTAVASRRFLAFFAVLVVVIVVVIVISASMPVFVIAPLAASASARRSGPA